MTPCGTKSVTLSMFIDLLTSTCRSTQVKIASTDLWPQELFTFSEMLPLVESESSFGAYVRHRRSGGSSATSDLVARHSYCVIRFLKRTYSVGRSCVELGGALICFEQLPCTSGLSFGRIQQAGSRDGGLESTGDSVLFCAMLLLTTTARERAWRLLKIRSQFFDYVFLELSLAFAFVWRLE